VDAFNLYFGSCKGTPYKWLDLMKLFQFRLPGHQIEKIKYFTARVLARPSDPDQPIRQQIYLRALQTIPIVEIYYGHFLTHVFKMRLANPSPGQNQYVNVVKTEEKGSDVNLATHLLCDGYNDRYECAVVVSGDSDLLAPIEVVMKELKKPVGVLNPQKKDCRVLLKQATFYKHIRKGVLAASQFPTTLTDAHGTISKPSSW
jgi:uncharacterized LabA/DUF88 family protein